MTSYPLQAAHWQSWTEVHVRLRGLPRGCSTADIYTHLKAYGEIVYIKLLNDSKCSTWGAQVVFFPPPREAFWDKYLRMVRDRRTFSYAAELLPNSPERLRRSPVNPTVLYEERMSVEAEALEFGFMHDADRMMVMHAVQGGESPMYLVLNLGRQEIDIQFPETLMNAQQPLRYRYRMTVPLSQIPHMLETTDDVTGRQHLIIPLELPPSYFRRHQEVEKTHVRGENTWNEWKAWYRKTVIIDDDGLGRWRGMPLSLDQAQTSNAVIDAGRWITYRLSFNHSPSQAARYARMRAALADYNVRVITDQNLSILPREDSPVWSILNVPRKLPEGQGTVIDLLALQGVYLPFDVRYQLEACITNGFLNEHNMTREFLERLAQIGPSTAKSILEKVFDLGRRFYNPMELFDLRGVRPRRRAVPKYCVYTHSVVITPTALYYTTPVLETSNRVIRQFIAFADRFLRVKFTEEKYKGQVRAQVEPTYMDIYLRIKCICTQGITIGDRHYEFLAFGNSQLRENGAYFFASSPELSADEIRKWMGDFSRYRIVAKYAARLGQSFSTTRAIHGTSFKVSTLADVKRNGYCFSDGVGKISFFLAQMIAGEFGLPNAVDDPPSVFQFRMGGCKGVLALDPSLPAQGLAIRESQYKFPARHEGLDIIRTSSWSVATLNRQLIVILSTLGVRDDIFIDKLRSMLTALDEAMRSEKVAMTHLQRNVDVNQTSLVIAGMISNGFMESKDPFLMAILQLWRTWTIKYLKEKARITIEKSAFLLGCMDETAALKGHFDNIHGEVTKKHGPTSDLPEIFLQISDPEKPGKYDVIEGICILGRNPALHPGDVRLVRAVDCPVLHHIKNAVVLPQTGDRPLANMCSGGDLDGDDYFVMWDEALFPEEWNVPAMEFDAAKGRVLKREVTVFDVTTFFIDYMRNNQLGAIANAHLAHADLSDVGVRDSICLELADLHSRAVDYAKTGVPAAMGREHRPRRWPHFMEKDHLPAEKTYHSTRVLGRLYDMVERVNFKPGYTHGFDKRVLDAYKLEQQMLDNASEIKELYDAAMLRIMAKYAVKTEFEVWTSFVLSHNSANDYKFGEELCQVLTSLKSEFKDMCYAKAGGKDFQHMGPFVAAMYTVTAREVEQAIAEYRGVRDLDGVKMPLISFPWIFVKELGGVATGTGASAVSYSGPVSVHKSQKRVGSTQIPSLAETAPGKDDIVTETGITHLGDLLELFDDAPPAKEPASDQADPSEEAATEASGELNPEATKPVEPERTSRFATSDSVNRFLLQQTPSRPEQDSFMPPPVVQQGLVRKPSQVALSMGASESQPTINRRPDCSRPAPGRTTASASIQEESSDEEQPNVLTPEEDLSASSTSESSRKSSSQPALPIAAEEENLIDFDIASSPVIASDTPLFLSGGGSEREDAPSTSPVAPPTPLDVQERLAKGIAGVFGAVSDSFKLLDDGNDVEERGGRSAERKENVTLPREGVDSDPKRKKEDGARQRRAPPIEVFDGGEDEADEMKKLLF